MIAVIVPAHDEEQLIGRCLSALNRAGKHPALRGELVTILVVLDACSDATSSVVAACGMESIVVSRRNVGAARGIGAQAGIRRGARWLAFTDADSEVSDDWLVRQLELRADAVCGVVEVDDWSAHPVHVRRAYEAGYADRDGHRHVHGANLAVSTRAYLRSGGFRPLARCEDVALVEALDASGAHIAWSAAVRVRTSARKVARAPGGFAAHLASLGSGDWRVAAA